MNIGIVTLFPEMFTALSSGISGRAIEQGLLNLHYWNPRDFTEDHYRTVDDRPYGGGPGMVMKVGPLHRAILSAKSTLGDAALVIYPSPQGQQFTQAVARTWTQKENLIFLAGRYEGVDQRLIDADVDEEWSIGDYVLSGGELAIMVMLDAVTRWIPGALGNAASTFSESFAENALEYPQYTRPASVLGRAVPPVLMSGDHAAIEEWRRQAAQAVTSQKRQDLLIEKN